MRELKKNFFLHLLQLTILAYFFRQSTRFSSPFDYSSDLLLTSSISSTIQRRLYQSNEEAENSIFNRSTDQVRLKETRQYLNDIRLLNLIKKLNSTEQQNNFNTTQHIAPIQPFLFILPALADPTSYHKSIINQSETRLLLNSIELNRNNNRQLTKDIQMDIDIQTILQQDIDLGIKGSLSYEFEEPSFDKYNKDELMYGSSSSFKSQEENQKNADILAATQMFENQNIPDGYKLILEEDTGESFLLLLNNENMTNNNNNSSSSPASLDSFNRSNSFTNATLENMQYLQIKDPAQEEKEINVKVRFSIFPNSQKQQPPHIIPQIVEEPQTVRPPFLSQTSVSHILGRLNETAEQYPMFDDSWFNTYLNNDSATIQNQQQNDLEPVQNVDQQNTSEPKIMSNEYIDMSKNQSLYNLNLNQSILNDTEPNNQTYTYQTPINNTYVQNGQEIMNDIFPQSFIDQVIIEENRLNDTNLYRSDQDYMGRISEEFENFLNSFPDNNNSSQNSTLSPGSILTNVTASSSSAFMDNVYVKSPSSDEAHLLATNLKQEAIDLSEDNSNASTSSSFIYSSDFSGSQETSLALSGFMHNHTYLQGSESSESDLAQHPYSYKNKLKKMRAAAASSDMNSNSSMIDFNKMQETRDEMLLKSNNIQLELSQVIDSSAEELNELIKVYSLDKDQVNVIKDIRRRGKNKVAAQICRKRKLDSIDSLKETVDELKEYKSKLHSEYNMIHNEIKQMTVKFDTLYKEAIGNNNFNSNDPIALFISNLKSQLNIKSGDSSSSSNVEASVSGTQRHRGLKNNSHRASSSNDENKNKKFKNL